MSPDAARILRHLRRHQTFADLTDGDCGADLCKIASDGCGESLDNGAAPDGTPLAPLSAAYARWKGHDKIGLLYGIMSDPDEMAGEVVVTPDRASVTYGITPEAKEEATWFQEGDPAQNRPPRPFWGLTADSIDRSDRYLIARLRKVLG